MRKPLLLGSAGLAVGLCLGSYLFFHQGWRLPHSSRIEHGRLLADRLGCFACHGPEGIAGIRNPSRNEKFEEHVPPWDGRSISEEVHNEQEIREWILDGMPARVRKDAEAQRKLEAGLIRMPAYRTFISQSELEDLITYYKAVAWFTKPKDPLAMRGLAVANQFDCFSCHGPLGRGSVGNIRSFKGYIPGWGGHDFKELVRDDQELEAWILDGNIKRFQDNRFARYFIEGQIIKMPAYRNVLSPDDLKAVKAYIRWANETFQAS